ncbi:SEC14-like protein 2 [Dermacentor andersoni]|uniref:SEC14-like protein 2 n=1 Tax=Dermacentor andersoni TaxID=34620 RepID=UPI0024163828|nr:SEC14-like protein 2 [Dermacentor andersoni]
MYRHDIEWRKQNGVDDMLKNYKTPQIVKENFPGAILHPCKDGCPIWIVPAGINVKAFLAALTTEAVQRHCIYQLEYLESLKRASSREAGQELETQYLVIDFDNFSIRNIYSWQVVKAITDVLQMMEDHFPECLEKCIAINAPSFFPILWRLIRPFLTQRTADKVEVFGKVDGWKELLLSIMDAASLPAHWGGDMVGPGNDPRCRHKVNYGGRFEEGVERGESLFGEAGVEQRTVSRRDRWELQVGVTKPGSRISWRFQVAAGDLTFGLRLLTGEPLLPLRRVETCSHAPQEGSWLCDSPGTYVLEFDNTHSWFTSKTLAYDVNVHSPEDAH